MTRKKQTVKIELEVEFPENATLDEGLTGLLGGYKM